MPALLRVRGYRFFFYSMEAHEPSHIQVAHAGRYAKFWLEPVALAQVRGFRGHELTGDPADSPSTQAILLGEVV